MRKKGIITVFVLAIIALYIIIYVVPSVTGMLDSTYVVEYGVLSIHDSTTGYLIRNEEVYAAEDSGSVNRLAQEGDLLRAGSAVVGISGGGTGSPSERLKEIKDELNGSMVTGHGNRVLRGGIVSYYVDGYENKLLPDSIENYSLKDLQEINQKQVVSLGATVTRDYPLFKLINSRGWYLIAYVPESKSHNYEVGSTINVVFGKPNETSSETDTAPAETDDGFDTYGSVAMKLQSVDKEGDSLKLVLKSSRFFSGLGELRVAECTLISANVRGLLIDNASIAEVDGVKGVFVKNKKGKYDFTPINVLGSDDKTTVVSDTYYYDSQGVWTRTVDPFDDILKNPKDQVIDDSEEEGEE